MSLDLLAEFGPYNDKNEKSTASRQSSAPQTQAATFSFFDDLSTLNVPSDTHVPTTLNTTGPAGTLDHSASVAYHTQPAANLDPDDDWGDFGEFEEAEAPLRQPVSTTTGASTGAWNSFQDVKRPPQPSHDQIPKRGQVQRLDTEDFFNSRLLSKAASQHVEHELRPHEDIRQKREPRSRDPNVLFDATEDFEYQDDFGDFEAAEPSKPKPKPVRAPSANLLDITDDLNSLNLGAPRSTAPPILKPPSASVSSNSAPSKSSASHSEKPKAQTPAKPSLRPPKPEPQPILDIAHDDEEAWDDFPQPAAPTAPSSTDPLPSLSTRTPPSPPPDALPPTTIPPPSLLLTLFPPLFAAAQTNLFHPLAAQSYTLRNRILSDPATAAFLRGYLSLGTVAAHVIAGRKLRWRRDGRLAQGMRIGPASSGGGMKLAGIDRAEAVKEEREVGEVVRAWGEQVGRVRAAVAGVKAGGGSIGEVPEIRETMAVRMVREVEGGVVAPRPCALCGLRREERVVKVDGAVEDSFGEWWVERMSMHRACRNFWEEHKEKLCQR